MSCPVIGAHVEGEPCGDDSVDGGRCCVSHTCEHPDCVEMATVYTVTEDETELQHRYCGRHFFGLPKGVFFVEYRHI
jgi:hypothetical protein